MAQANRRLKRTANNIDACVLIGIIAFYRDQLGCPEKRNTAA